MHRNELFNMEGFTAVVTGGGTGEGLPFHVFDSSC
jgi:hypothetical protein